MKLKYELKTKKIVKATITILKTNPLQFLQLSMNICDLNELLNLELKLRMCYSMLGKRSVLLLHNKAKQSSLVSPSRASGRNANL